MEPSDQRNPSEAADAIEPDDAITPIDPARFHTRSLIVDGLNASYFRSAAVLRRLQEGGVTAVNATIAAWHTLEETMHMIAAFHYLFEAHADTIMPVQHVFDVRRAKATKRVGLVLGFQDSKPIHGDEQILAVYRALGVRIIQLTYNDRNDVGCGCMVPEDTGLTPFGRKVVAEMNRLGILIDLSHCGPRTTREAIEASTRPVAITHANSRMTCNVERNKPDDVLQLLVARGGVVGATAVPMMLTGGTHATLEDYLTAVDYLVSLLGVDGVGLGPDFMEEMPREVMVAALSSLSPERQEELLRTSPTTEGFSSIADYPRVTEGLFARGYSEGDVRKLMGENWLWLYEEAWEPGARDGDITLTGPAGRRRTDPDFSLTRVPA